jgi:hypothetical protein
MHAKDVDAAVAVASNDLHRRDVIEWRNDKSQERPMGAVMVRCPQTGRDIPTGLTTDRKSFEAMPVFFARVHCPICRTEHEWFAKEAWVCDAEPRPQRPQRKAFLWAFCRWQRGRFAARARWWRQRMAAGGKRGKPFAERALWNVRLHQSALAPENLTTLAHFSTS